MFTTLLIVLGIMIYMFFANIVRLTVFNEEFEESISGRGLHEENLAGFLSFIFPISLMITIPKRLARYVCNKDNWKFKLKIEKNG